MARFTDAPGDIVILITRQSRDPCGDDSPAQVAAQRRDMVALCLTSRHFATVLRPFLRSKLEVVAPSHAYQAISVVRAHGYGHEVRELTISCASWECGKRSGGQGPASDFEYCSGYAVLVELLDLCRDLTCLRIHRLHGRQIDEACMVRLMDAGNGTLARLQALELQSPVNDLSLRWPSPIAQSTELILRRLPFLETLYLAGDFRHVGEAGGANPPIDGAPFSLNSLHLRNTQIPCRFIKWLVNHDQANVLANVEISGRTHVGNLWIPRCRSLTLCWPSRVDIPPLDALVDVQAAQSKDYTDLRTLRLDLREARTDEDLQWLVGLLLNLDAVHLQSLRIDLADMDPSTCIGMQTEVADMVLNHPSLQKLRRLVLTAPSDLPHSDRLQQYCDARDVRLEVFSHSSDGLLRAYKEQKALEHDIESGKLRDFRARYKYGERFQGQQLGDPVIWELLPRERSTTWSEAFWRVMLHAFWIVQYTVTGPKNLLARLLSSGARPPDASSNSTRDP